MANTIKVIDKIAAVAAEIFTEVSYVARNSVRSIEDEFAGSAKIGNSVRVRIPSRYSVNSDTFSNGKTSYSRGTRNAIAQETRTLTCDQSQWIGMDLTSEELAVFAGDSAKDMRSLLEQPIANLARQTDIYMFGQMALLGQGRISLIDASKGFTTDDASQLNAALAEQLAATGDRKLALGALDMSKAQISAKGLFQSAADIAEQYKKGVVSVGQGFDSWFDTQSLPTITIGTAFSDGGGSAPVTVRSTYSMGDAVLMLNGTAATTISKYQAIEVGSVYAIDPQTLTAVPRKATLIVQEDVTFDSTGVARVKVAPLYTVAGNITLANVSAYPVAAAKVKIVENDGATNVNGGKLAKVVIAWQKKAVAFATIPLPSDLPGAEASSQNADGIDIRVVRQYDKDANTVTTIADLQYGGLITRPEWIGSSCGMLA